MMADYLKHYQMELKAIGPVHIGSGKKLLKKEYIYRWRRGIVLIPDETALIDGLRKYHVEDKFIDYILRGSNYKDLGGWLDDQGIPRTEYEQWVSYRLEGGDILAERSKGIDVLTCLKDNYRQPYIPGSSIKGMFRTILLAAELLKRNRNYSASGSKVVAKAAVHERDRRRYLKSEITDIENRAFHTLRRVDERGKEVPLKDAVNDCLSGLIVSDSEPLETSDLILCQKMDVTVDGETNKLPILREALRPGTVFRFTVTIDPKVCSYDINDILAAAELFNNAYYDMYVKMFAGADRPLPGTVYLGGGTGYFTKTVLYPLLGYKEGLRTASRILDQTLPPKIREKHGHNLDARKGVSPHMLKCTEYRGKRYQMGMCTISLVE